jgi:threonine/homoserine/homoserine lactone efflux protein
MKARKWMMEYGVAVLFAVLCGVVLGHLPLFRETAVGKLHASDLVQFIGYGGAMVLAWLGARQLADEPPEDWKWLIPYRALILPIVTLATVALAYVVLLFACEPFLTKAGKEIYNWVFVIGIVAGCAWLIVMWVQKCAPHVAAMESRRLRKAA